MARRSGSRPLLPPDVNAAQRAAQVVQLRIAGLTQDEIAERVGLSQSRISRIIKTHLKAQREQNTEDLRTLEVERTEALHRAVWPKALRGDAGAANIVLKASERRSRLQGLDENGDGGAGGAGTHVIVQVIMEAFTVSTSDELDEVGQAAARLGIQLVQAAHPDAAVEGVFTRMVIMRADLRDPYELKPSDYDTMLTRYHRGEYAGV